MLKRFLTTLWILAGLLSPANAAGTIPGISMTQQLDASAKPLSGGLLYLIQAGTTSTPQNCYQDTALTIAYPNPITLDASGRIPQLFCADGNIKIRLTDKNGVTQLVQDNLLVVGASSGGGGGGTVDATTILATGDLKVRYGTGSLSGFVRANGRTIGSSTSGATERANADVQALFEYLWGADANLTVSGGRGASASADWTANKTIALPDFRGSYLAFFDGMGNSKAGRITSTYLGVDADTIGLIPTPEQTRTIANTNLPPYTPSGSVTINSITTGGNTVYGWSGTGTVTGGAGTTSAPQIGNMLPINGGTAGFTGTAAFGRNSTPFSILPPTSPLVTAYLKL